MSHLAAQTCIIWHAALLIAEALRYRRTNAGPSGDNLAVDDRSADERTMSFLLHRDHRSSTLSKLPVVRSRCTLDIRHYVTNRGAVFHVLPYVRQNKSSAVSQVQMVPGADDQGKMQGPGPKTWHLGSDHYILLKTVPAEPTDDYLSERSICCEDEPCA